MHAMQTADRAAERAQRLETERQTAEREFCTHHKGTERERERDRDRDRDKDKDTADTDRDGQTDTDTDRDRQRQTDR